MKTETRESKPGVTLAPGETYVTDQALVITTLLGSCGSVCLFDSDHKILGMNHFLLSNQLSDQSDLACASEAGRYGIHTMELIRVIRFDTRNQKTVTFYHLWQREQHD